MSSPLSVQKGCNFVKQQCVAEPPIAMKAQSEQSQVHHFLAQGVLHQGTGIRLARCFKGWLNAGLCGGEEVEETGVPFLAQPARIGP